MKRDSKYILKCGELSHRVADCLDRLKVPESGYHLKTFEVLFAPIKGMKGEDITERQRRKIVSRLMRGLVNPKYEQYVCMLEDYTSAIETIWNKHLK